MSTSKYGQLDDIGFVGYQKKKSKAEIKRDTDRTVAFIKAYKAKVQGDKEKNLG